MFCRIGRSALSALEPVSLWSNEEARSADTIIAWAVRPRECETKASSAEGAADIVARVLAGNIGKLNQREPPYIDRHLGGSPIHRAFSAGPLMGTFSWA